MIELPPRGVGEVPEAGGGGGGGASHFQVRSARRAPVVDVKPEPGLGEAPAAISMALAAAVPSAPGSLLQSIAIAKTKKLSKVNRMLASTVQGFKCSNFDVRTLN